MAQFGVTSALRAVANSRHESSADVTTAKSSYSQTPRGIRKSILFNVLIHNLEFFRTGTSRSALAWMRDNTNIRVSFLKGACDVMTAIKEINKNESLSLSEFPLRIRKNQLISLLLTPAEAFLNNLNDK